MKRYVFILLVCWLAGSGFSVSPHNNLEEDPMVDFLLEYVKIKYNGYDFDRFIYVAAKRQRLYLVNEGEVEKTYKISTAKNGIGTDRGSYCTPAGLHKVAEKVGDGLPLYSIIKNKMPTGAIAPVINAPESSGEDLITTRIFHLTGLEERINKGGDHDSYSRGIFIHGTHEEGLLGTPASKGCVRMSNKEVIELFESVEVGTFVVILNN